MSTSTYAVPYHGFGATHALAVEGVTPDVFTQLMGHKSETTVAVTLGHAPHNEGFNVYRNEQLIGTIPAKAAAEYPELQWILEAGLSPKVTARMALNGEDYPAIDVLLPPAGLCVPANNPPEVRWAMVEGTTPMTLHSIPTTLASYPLDPQHFLVTLRAKRFFTHRTVSAYVDGTFVGMLGHDDAQKLADTIISYDHSGLVAIARGYYEYVDGQPSLTIYAEPAEETRNPFAVAAGTAATTGLVLSAAAVARAEAAIPMTGFFTAPSLPTVGLAAGAAGAAGVAGTGTTGVGAAGKAGAASTAASATGTAGASGAVAAAAATSSVVGLQSLAAASTAIIAVGGIGVATMQTFTSQRDDTTVAAPATSQDDTPPVTDFTTRDEAPGAPSAPNAGLPGAASAGAGTSDRGGDVRPDTNAGLSLDDLRSAVGLPDGFVLAQAELPTRLETARALQEPTEAPREDETNADDAQPEAPELSPAPAPTGEPGDRGDDRRTDEEPVADDAAEEFPTDSAASRPSRSTASVAPAARPNMHFAKPTTMVGEPEDMNSTDALASNAAAESNSGDKTSETETTATPTTIDSSAATPTTEAPSLTPQAATSTTLPAYPTWRYTPPQVTSTKNVPSAHPTHTGKPTKLKPTATPKTQPPTVSSTIPVITEKPGAEPTGVTVTVKIVPIISTPNTPTTSITPATEPSTTKAASGTFWIEPAVEPSGTEPTMPTSGSEWVATDAPKPGILSTIVSTAKRAADDAFGIEPTPAGGEQLAVVTPTAQ